MVRSLDRKNNMIDSNIDIQIYPNRSKNSAITECIIILAVIQMFLAHTIPNLKVYQIPVEIILGLSLIYACSLIRFSRLDILLISVFLIVTTASFLITDAMIFLVNMKQNGLAVLSLIYFSKIQHRSKVIFPVFILSLFMLVLNWVYPEVMMPFINLSFTPGYNLSRFGGIFLNAHYNAYFMAIVLIYYSYRNNLYGLGVIIIYFTAAKTTLISYLANYYSRLPVFETIIKYRAVVLMILFISLYSIIHYRNILIEFFDTDRLSSLAIILMQLSDPAYYKILLNPFPSGDINVSSNAIAIHKSHGGGSEIGYFDIATQSGIFFGVIYLYILLKFTRYYRVFILVSLLHHQYFYSPLLLYMIMNYSRMIHLHSIKKIFEKRHVETQVLFSKPVIQ